MRVHALPDVIDNSHHTNLGEIALDEVLDSLDPLRHLRNQEAFQDTDEASDEIIPAQPRSILDETLQISFPNIITTPVNCENITVSLTLDATSGCGGIAWPAGVVLSNYLVVRGRDYVLGKKIIELGSGTGLVGLVAGFLGAEVCITDQAPLLDIMRSNVIMNNLHSSVAVSELNWGEPLPSNVTMPDMILAADCVYFEPAFPLLVQTLSDLTTEKTEILFCYKKRRKADKRFFALLKKKFNWIEITDDPNREVYSREAISLLMLSKRGS